MKKLTLLAPLLLAACLHAPAQEPADGLTVTLPSGKVLTFQSAEQKAQFLAAREKAAHAASTPPPTLAPRERVPFGQGALDQKPAMSGKVNVSAPTFTADYYLFAPDTWVGKPATLSVGYLTLVPGATHKDGMVEYVAHTWGTIQSNAEQHSGGMMTILATPAASQRIATLCGTRLQYLGWLYKVTLLKGEFTVLGGEDAQPKRYGMIVTQ